MEVTAHLKRRRRWAWELELEATHTPCVPSSVKSSCTLNSLSSTAGRCSSLVADRGVQHNGRTCPGRAEQTDGHWSGVTISLITRDGNQPGSEIRVSLTIHNGTRLRDEDVFYDSDGVGQPATVKLSGKLRRRLSYGSRVCPGLVYRV